MHGLQPEAILLPGAKRVNKGGENGSYEGCWVSDLIFVMQGAQTQFAKLLMPAEREERRAPPRGEICPVEVHGIMEQKEA